MSVGENKPLGVRRQWGLTATLEKDPDGRNVTSWKDKEGVEVYRVRWPRPYRVTPDEVYATHEDPTTYHREYYRRVRAARDGRVPRKANAVSP